MNTDQYNGLDWLLIVAVGASTLFGFRAGFARVVIGLVSGFVGVFFALWFYETPAAWFKGMVSSPTAAGALGFLVVFAATIAVGGIFARLLAGVFKWAGLSWLDRVLGAGAGFVRGMVLVLAVVGPLLAFAPDPLPPFLSQSKLLPYTTSFGRVMVAVAPKQLREQFDLKVDSLKDLWQKAESQLPPPLKSGKPEPEPAPAPESKKKAQPMKRQAY